MTKSELLYDGSKVLALWIYQQIEDALCIARSYMAYPAIAFGEELLHGEVRTTFEPTTYCRRLDNNGGYSRAAIAAVYSLAFMPAKFAISTIATVESYLRERDFVQKSRIDFSGTPVIGGICTRIRNLVNSWSEVLGDRESEIRGIFSELAIPTVNTQQSHTHGICAATRGRACYFATALAANLGLDLYSVQGSAQDARRGIPYSRVAYWGKDLGMNPHESKLGRKPLIYMCDVDFHVPHLESMLANNFYPTLLYTCVPTAAGDSFDNQSFSFANDGTMTTLVAGGGRFEHKLWNYNTDCITVSSSYLGVPVWTAVYKCEKRHVTKHKALVFLVPVSRWYGPLGVVASWLYNASRLTRFNPVEGEFVRIDSRNDADLSVSICRVGDYTSCCVPIGDFEAASRAHSMVDAKYMSIYTINTWLEKNPQARVYAAILLAYFDANPPRKGVVTSRYVAPSIEYTANVKTYGDEAERPSLTPFMTPLDPNSYVSTNHRLNGLWAAKSRVVDLQIKPKVDIAGHVVDKLVEFQRYIAPDGVCLIPMNVEEMMAAQARPTQRRIINVSSGEGSIKDDATLTTFKKSEAYNEIKDPRVITTLPGGEKLLITTIPMSVTVHLKKFCWYAFKKPREICDNIGRIGRGSEMAVCLDVSRMDGNTGHIPRTYVQMPIYRRLFPQHSGLITQYFKLILNRKARISHEYSYDTGLSTLSGGPGTSSDNTIIGVSITYLAMRLSGLGHNEAVDVLDNSMFGGDDAVTFFHRGMSEAETIRVYTAAGNILGYPLKLKIIQRGGYVDFLGRYFKPWDGDTCSVADIPRQITKLHMTVGSVDPVTKALEKALSIILTDAHTPVLGEWAAAVIAKYGNQAEGVIPDTERWWSQFDSTDQFDNQARDWYLEYMGEVYPEFNTTIFAEAIKLAEPLKMPPCVDQRPVLPGTVDVVANGVLVPSPGGAIREPKDGKRIEPPNDGVDKTVGTDGRDSRRGRGIAGRGRGRSDPTPDTNAHAAEAAPGASIQAVRRGGAARGRGATTRQRGAK